MDFAPLGQREVTICEINASMLRHGKRKAAKKGYTKGEVVFAYTKLHLFVGRDHMGARRCHKSSICR